MVEKINEQELIDADSYSEIKEDIDELFDGSVDKGEFDFRLETLHNRVTALSRGHFCILLARPEMGKTTLSSFLVSISPSESNFHPLSANKLFLSCVNLNFSKM